MKYLRLKFPRYQILAGMKDQQIVSFDRLKRFLYTERYIYEGLKRKKTTAHKMIFYSFQS